MKIASESSQIILMLPCLLKALACDKGEYPSINSNAAALACDGEGQSAQRSKGPTKMYAIIYLNIVPTNMMLIDVILYCFYAIHRFKP